MSVLGEWIEKAEADFQGATDLKRRRKAPLPDLVCYHCQQSAEKYLKAYLIAQGVVPPAIHDLNQLLLLCTHHDPTLVRFQALAQTLNPYGVLIRYPGLSATATDADTGMDAVRRIRCALRRRLGL